MTPHAFEHGSECACSQYNTVKYAQQFTVACAQDCASEITAQESRLMSIIIIISKEEAVVLAPANCWLQLHLERCNWQPVPCGRSLDAANADVASDTVAAGLRMTL